MACCFALFCGFRVYLYFGVIVIFTEEFLATLKDSPIDGVIKIFETVENCISQSFTGYEGNEYREWNDGDREILIEAYGLILGIIASGLLEYEFTPVRLTGVTHSDFETIYSCINEIHAYCAPEASNLKLSSLKNHFKNLLTSRFCYEFSQGNLERIQTLINELRESIAKTDDLEKEHQQRLLRRLETMQAEIHKKMSDLDRFWGLIGDAGVVLGKLGTDAKPIVDRIREIATIVWVTQSRAEELPSGTHSPLLGYEVSSDSE